jgi:very-short-patch-repair endonuclease
MEARVVVEVDGSQHMESLHDAGRDTWLASEGYKVLRFWNHDVLARTDAVLTQICEALAAIGPLPPSGHLPPQAGEGKPR